MHPSFFYYDVFRFRKTDEEGSYYFINAFEIHHGPTVLGEASFSPVKNVFPDFSRKKECELKYSLMKLVLRSGAVSDLNFLLLWDRFKCAATPINMARDVILEFVRQCLCRDAHLEKATQLLHQLIPVGHIAI